jgi:hypothetical protein
MAKHYRIRIQGAQREPIDDNLLIGLVVLLGRQLARQAEEEALEQGEAGEAAEPDDGATDAVE